MNNKHIELKTRVFVVSTSLIFFHDILINMLEVIFRFFFKGRGCYK